MRCVEIAVSVRLMGNLYCRVHGIRACAVRLCADSDAICPFLFFVDTNTVSFCNYTSNEIFQVVSLSQTIEQSKHTKFPLRLCLCH